MLCGDAVREPEQRSKQDVAANRTRHADDEGVACIGVSGKAENGGDDDAEHEGNEEDEEVQHEERVIQDAVTTVVRVAQLVIDPEVDLKEVHHEEADHDPSYDVVRAHHEERSHERAEEQGHAKLAVTRDVEHRNTSEDG